MRRLVVFSDPGGAKPCLALAVTWQADDDVLVCSDRRYAFYELFGVPVREARHGAAVAIMDTFRPDAVFTGTSYTSRIELEFIRAASAKGIPSASFVDHHTGFDVRFGTGNARILPDEIHVVDESARALAVAAGLPDETLRIMANPYHAFLRRWRSGLTTAQVFQRLGVEPSGSATILFAPDPLSNAGGAAKFGTDEVTILQVLLESLGALARPFLLLVKAHPNQSLEYLHAGLRSVPANVAVHIVPPEQDALLNDLIQKVDRVVGMFSNLLVEAELLGARTLRILCGIHVADPLAHRSSGQVARDKADIQLALRDVE